MTINKLNLFCFAALCIICYPAAAESTAKHPTETAKPTLEFANKVYALEFVAGKPDVGFVNEYIRKTETLDRWTTMIAVRHLPHLKDGKVAAVDVVRGLKAINPKAPSQLWMNEKEDSVGLDFITWQGDKIAEFNIFIYRTSPDGKGLVLHQFAKRAYRENMRPFLRSLKDDRAGLLQEVQKFKFPDVIKPNANISTDG